MRPRQRTGPLQAIGPRGRTRGRLTSPPFRIERRFIAFLIGGGAHAGRTCLNLLLEGRLVRTATFTLGTDGNLTGKVEEVSWGEPAAERREVRSDIDLERLRKLSPKFVDWYEAAKT